MDPSTFFGVALGAIIAATSPADAGVVCDRRGFCVAQPQFQQRYYPPPPYYYPPPPIQQPQPQQDTLGAEVKAEIYEFCDRHPGEAFCGKLNLYLQQHPDAR